MVFKKNIDYNLMNIINIKRF